MIYCPSFAGDDRISAAQNAQEHSGMGFYEDRKTKKIKVSVHLPGNYDIYSATIDSHGQVTFTQWAVPIKENWKTALQEWKKSLVYDPVAGLMRR